MLSLGQIERYSRHIMLKEVGGEGQEKLLNSRVLMYDALAMSFRNAPIRRNPRCPVCGEQPIITGLRDEAGAASACDLKGHRHAADTTAHP